MPLPGLCPLLRNTLPIRPLLRNALSPLHDDYPLTQAASLPPCPTSTSARTSRETVAPSPSEVERQVRVLICVLRLPVQTRCSAVPAPPPCNCKEGCIPQQSPSIKVAWPAARRLCLQYPRLPAQPTTLLLRKRAQRASRSSAHSHNTSRASGLASLLLSCNSSRDTEERAQPRDYLLNLLEKQNWVLSTTSPSCSFQAKQTDKKMSSDPQDGSSCKQKLRNSNTEREWKL